MGEMEAAAVMVGASSTAVSMATPLVPYNARVPNVGAIGKKRFVALESSMMGRAVAVPEQRNWGVCARKVVKKVAGVTKTESSPPRKSPPFPLLDLYEFICR